MGRPRSYDRDDVLRRATRLFWERGYEGTHLQALVEATGVNRFSLYAEFGGKEGLFRAALERYIEDLAGLEEPLRRDPPGLDNVRAYYRGFLASKFLHGCLALNTIREKHLLPAGVFARVEAFAHAAEALFRRNLEAAGERGELPPGSDPLALAQLLTALDFGLLTYDIVARDPGARGRVLLQVERLLGLEAGGTGGQGRGPLRR
jgi:TetR/AcrR family transcriptional repressor of nem operon